MCTDSGKKRGLATPIGWLPARWKSWSPSWSGRKGQVPDGLPGRAVCHREANRGSSPRGPARHGGTYYITIQVLGMKWIAGFPTSGAWASQEVGNDSRTLTNSLWLVGLLGRFLGWLFGGWPCRRQIRTDKWHRLLNLVYRYTNI